MRVLRGVVYMLKRIGPRTEPYKSNNSNVLHWHCRLQTQLTEVRGSNVLCKPANFIILLDALVEIWYKNRLFGTIWYNLQFDGSITKPVNTAGTDQSHIVKCYSVRSSNFCQLCLIIMFISFKLPDSLSARYNCGSSTWSIIIIIIME